MSIVVTFSLTGVLCAGSLDPWALATQHTTEINSYNYWSAIGQQAQYYQSGSLNLDVPFAPTVALETPTMMPVPSNSKNLLCFLALRVQVLTN